MAWYERPLGLLPQEEAAFVAGRRHAAMRVARSNPWQAVEYVPSQATVEVVARGARFSNGLVIKCDDTLDLAMEKGELFRDLQHCGVRLGLCLAEFLNEDDIASLLSTAVGASPC